MKRKITFIFIAFLLSQFSFAQITEKEDILRSSSIDTIDGWKKGGIIGLNISQASFSNWAAGGQNSFAFNGLISVYANYKKGKFTLANNLDLGYGVMQQGKKGSLIKTDDKIDFSQKYGRAAFANWYYALLLNFKTQMSPAYNYPNDSVKISDFLAPAYLLVALGLDYKPNEHFTAFIAPITSKTTIVNNRTLANAGAFGVTPAVYDNKGTLLSHGKLMRNEIGGYAKMVYSNTFFKDKSVSLLSKLDLFSNYTKNPQNVDVSWETIIGFKVNDYISATLTTHLLYDDDIDIVIDSNEDGLTDAVGPRVQFKEVIAIGFTYKW